MNQIVENTARKLLRQLYNQGFQLRGINSPTSEIFVAEFLDDSPPVIMKIPRAVNEEALREQRILDSLEGTGIPVPQVLYTQENFPAGNLVYTISRYIKGPDIREVIKWNDDRTHAIFTQIGKLTGQLARLPLNLIPDGFSPQEVQENELQWWENQLEFVSRHRGTTRLLDQIYHAARGIMLSLPQAFGHRDGVQAVTDGTKVYVIDVGSAGANWADADFARMLYGNMVWHGGDQFRIWREAAQAAYLEHRELSDADVERILILMSYYAMRDAATHASTGRSTHVDRLYVLAEFILHESRRWFRR